MKHLKVDIHAHAGRSIEMTANRLALEADVLADFSNLLSATIPTLASNLASSFGKSFSTVSKFISNFSPENRLNNQLSAIPYSELTNLKGYVPEGFIGNAAEYVKVLQESLDHSNKIIGSVINPYNAYISELLSSEDSLKSSSGKPQFLTRADHERAALNAEVGRFFKAGVTTADKLGKFYHRSSELFDVKTRLISVSAQLADSDVDLVQKATRDAVDLLSALTSSNSLGELKSISPQAVKALGESTLTVAKEVEFYAITRYRAEVFIKCFQDTLETLKKVMSNGSQTKVAQEELTISMEGDTWNSIHRFFDKMSNSVHGAVSKSHFNYYDPKDIAAFFDKANAGEVSFKKGTVPSQRRSAYFVIEGKPVSNIAQAILTETKFLQTASTTGATTDANFLQLIRDTIKELNETEKTFDYARIYERRKTALTTTPVSHFENHKFVSIPGSDLIKDWQKQGQHTFQDIPTWEHGKKYAGIALPACTDADLKKLQGAIGNLLELVFKSDATLEKYEMQWNEHVKSDNFNNQFTREDEDPEQEYIDLDNWLTQSPKATHSPYVCTMVKKMAVTLLEATCNWIRESSVISKPAK